MIVWIYLGSLSLILECDLDFDIPIQFAPIKNKIKKCNKEWYLMRNRIKVDSNDKKVKKCIRDNNNVI